YVMSVISSNKTDFEFLLAMGNGTFLDHAPHTNTLAWCDFTCSNLGRRKKQINIIAECIKRQANSRCQAHSNKQNNPQLLATVWFHGTPLNLIRPVKSGLGTSCIFGSQFRIPRGTALLLAYELASGQSGLQ